MNFGFVIDNGSCIGCHACSTACKSENEVPLGVYRTWVKTVEVGQYPDVQRSFQVTRCNHCSNPPCVRICPTSAMHRRPDGIVDFDSDACIGCKACTQACPYDAIHIDPDSRTAAKCNFCAHRVDIGLEPACVVVCPEHAILAGDLDDPESEVSRALGRRAVTVRKPEQGTAPKLFYIEGNDAAQHPGNVVGGPHFAHADAAPHRVSGSPPVPGQRMASSIRLSYDAQHEVQWHWPIPAYLVTKSVAGGVFGLLAATALVPGWFVPAAAAIGGALAVLLTLVTLALLVYDLDRPDRFFYLLLRPQWRSWIARAAWLLAAFSIVTGGWWALETAGWLGLVAVPPLARGTLAVLALPLSALAATYTAFLFAQAEGRDLWQVAHLPVVMGAQGVLLGALALLGVGAFGPEAAVLAPAGRALALGAAALALGVTLVGDLAIPPPSEIAQRTLQDLVFGRFRLPYRAGLALGYVAPMVLVAVGDPMADLAALLSAAVGVFLWSWALVMAPQAVPNS
jgi:Fe-S-cluster-containing dehydrogenase component